MDYTFQVYAIVDNTRTGRLHFEIWTEAKHSTTDISPEFGNDTQCRVNASQSCRTIAGAISAFSHPQQTFRLFPGVYYPNGVTFPKPGMKLVGEGQGVVELHCGKEGCFKSKDELFARLIQNVVLKPRNHITHG